MKISIITPTAERARYLQGTYQLLKNQTHKEWEWLIYDTSLRPNAFRDPRITYIHDEGIVSIGGKRNRLIDKAKGEIIVHFDDDDYYAPDYLVKVLDRLQKASFTTLSSWFSYHKLSHQFYYWDTSEGGESRFVLNSMTGARIREIDWGQKGKIQDEALNFSGKTGYGFSYAYRKEVLNKCTFPDLDFSEDTKFYEQVAEADFPIHFATDRQGTVVHVIHDSNTSSEFPQYRVPRFLVEPLLPPFFSYLKEFHEN